MSEGFKEVLVVAILLVYAVADTVKVEQSEGWHLSIYSRSMPLSCLSLSSGELVPVFPVVGSVVVVCWESSISRSGKALST